MAGNVWRFAKQMTDFVRQGKLAVSLCETCSTCPVTRTNKKELLLLFVFLGFFHHFELKKCLLKKLFPTLLTRFFRYVILTLQTKIQEHLNEKIYCSFALLDYVILNNFV